MYLPIIILAPHPEDLAGLEAAHQVSLAVLLCQGRGLLGRHGREGWGWGGLLNTTTYEREHSLRDSFIHLVDDN